MERAEHIWNRSPVRYLPATSGGFRADSAPQGYAAEIGLLNTPDAPFIDYFIESTALMMVKGDFA